MIYWHEYKEYKRIAKILIENGESDNTYIQAELEFLFSYLQTEEDTIENIINILSNGKHFSKI